MYCFVLHSHLWPPLQCWPASSLPSHYKETFTKPLAFTKSPGFLNTHLVNHLLVWNLGREYTKATCNPGRYILELHKVLVRV